jgi:hypothetical protein
MREHLDSHGFRSRGEWLCQANGVLTEYKVCASVREISPTTALVSWSI